MKTTETKAARAPRDFQSRIKKLALIGCGKLGEGLLSGMLGSQLIPVENVEVTVAHQPRADYLAEKYGVRAHTNNAQAVKGADLVLIVLKPQQVKGFLHEVKSVLRKDAVIISAAASVTTALIERELGRPTRAIRAMPNTPCLIRQGMTAIAASANASPGRCGAGAEKSSAPWAAPWWWMRSTWTPSPASPLPAPLMFT